MTSSALQRMGTAPIVQDLGSTAKSKDRQGIAFGSFFSAQAGANKDDNQNTLSLPGSSPVPSGGSNAKDFYQSTGGSNKIPAKFEKASKDFANVQDVSEQNDYISKVTKELTEKLDITEDELKEVMQAMGITFFELVDPSNLTALVSQLTGSSDVSELLCSEAFQDLLKAVMPVTDKLLEDLGMSREDLLKLIQQMAAQDKAGIDAQPNPGNGGSQAQTAVAAEFAETAVAQAEEADPLPEVAKPLTALTEEVTQVVEEEVLPASGKQDKGTNVPVPKEAVTEAPKQNAVTGEATVEEAPAKIVGESENRSGSGTNESPEEEAETARKPESELTAKTEESKEPKELKFSAAHLNAQTATPTTATSATVPIRETLLNADSILRQILDGARTQITREQSSVEILLNPANLGKVMLQVSAREGMITAQLAAETEAVKRILETRVAELKENLNQQGLKVEAVEVTVASHAFDRNLQGQPGQEAQAELERRNQEAARRNLSKEDLEEIGDDLSEEEALAAQIMLDQGNSMDMTA
ncbi:hypothetical protein FACS1894111_02440 [Clostridia bacterium]|nr:hypothetical protein FACS1894111_02440 [Clostridia bacterium]